MVKLTLTVQGDTGEGPKILWVRNTWEEALEKILPLSPPSSSLQSREACTWVDAEGNEVLCSGHYIATAENNQEPT